jgi:death-on-curing family protein
MARKRSETVKRLATEYGMEIDDVMLICWEIGLERDVLGKDSVLRGEDLKLVRAEISRVAKPSEDSADHIGIPEDENLAARPRVIFNWRLVGKARLNRSVIAEDVENFHNQLTEDMAESDDPVSPPGARNRNLLYSAVESWQLLPEKYPTLVLVIATVVYSIISNHPFYNGNKRTAMIYLLVMLEQNGQLLTCSDDDLFDFALKIAEHGFAQREVLLSNPSDYEIFKIAEWLDRNTREKNTKRQAITFAKFIRLLKDNGARVEIVGTQASVTRLKKRGGLFAFRPNETLRTRFEVMEKGQEVASSLVKKVRRELALDETHGVDTSEFYNPSKAERSSEDFINEYRTLLARLART